MFSPSALPLEAQASALVTFLARANFNLDETRAREICAALPSAMPSPARYLKNALADCGIALKHTACLTALSLIAGFDSYVARPKPQYKVALYHFGAPAVTARVQGFNRFSDALTAICERLGRDLRENDEAPYACLTRTATYIEVMFFGEPLNDFRVLLSCQEPGGTLAALDTGDVKALVERLRRLVEVQHRGWLDGALYSVPPGVLPRRLSMQAGEDVAEGLESDILSFFEDPGVAPGSHPGQGGDLPNVTVDDGSPYAKGVELEQAEVARLFKRLEAWKRTHDEKLAGFLHKRRLEHSMDDFAPVGINTLALREALRASGISPEDFAKRAGLLWEQAIQEEGLPVRVLLQLPRLLGLESANDLYLNPSPAPWMPILSGKEIQIWLKNFDHLEIAAFGIADGQPAARALLQRLKGYQRKSAGEQELERLRLDIEAAGYTLCSTAKKMFVSDLPIPRERLAIVGVIGLWDAREVAENPMSHDNQDTETPKREWTAVDDEYLVRFNATRVTVDDLIRLQTEVSHMRENGAEHDFETLTFAAFRAFRHKEKGEPRDSAHFSHTAVTRLTALSELIAARALPLWIEPSTSDGMSMVPRNVLEAAARCPLVRIKSEAGFDAAEFNRIAVQFVARY